MSLTQHIKYSSIPFLILLPIVGVKALYFFLASILIDVDHYPMYVLATRSYSIKGMFRYCYELFEYAKDKPFLGLCIFHTVEFLMIFAIMSFYSSASFYILLGLVYHILLDSIYLYREGCLFKKAFSIIEYLVRKKAWSHQF